MLWASAAEIAGVGKLALPSSRPGLLTKLGLTWIVAALSMPARVSTPAKKWLASLGTLTPVVVVGSAISQLIETHAHSAGLVEIVGEFAGALKSAMRMARNGGGAGATA